MSAISRAGWLLSGLLFSGAAAAQTTACRHPDFPQEVRCGVVQQPLNPDQPAGTKVDIHYVVLPSQDKNKLPDAVFLLAGGPGQSAIQLAAAGNGMLGRLNKRRDLVFVDQRGTGKSAGLQCPELEKDDFSSDDDVMFQRMEQCRIRLQNLPHGQLDQYITSIAVKDLEAVRRQQGYAQINLVGVSYGTRVGLEYLRQFPAQVRRLVLDGVVPPDMRLPAEDNAAAIEGIFRFCEQDKACNQAYPDLKGQWNHLLQSLPQKVNLQHPRTGQMHSVTMRTGSVTTMVQRALYVPSQTAMLPYAISRAAHGDFLPMTTLSGAGNLPGAASMSYGMHYAVWCSEALQRPAAKNDGSIFMLQAEENYQRICKNWPRARVPEAFYTIAPSPVPVLLLSGGIDPVTPTRHGDKVAKALGQKTLHISVQHAGHGMLMNACMRDVNYRFIHAKEEKDALAVDQRCVKQIPRPLAWMPVQAKAEGQP